MDARPNTHASGREPPAVVRAAQKSALLELLVRVKEAQYRPNPGEMKVLTQINQQILLSYTAGTVLCALPGVLAYRYWRPQSFFRSSVSAMAAATGIAYGGSLGFVLTRDGTLKKLLELEGSPLQGELVAILRERDPNDPMLATLKSKPNTSGVMYDENGERAYPRLTSSTPGASQPEPDFKPSDQARSVRRSEFDQPSESGKKELDARDGLRERIRADLERRRQRSGGAGMGGEADPDLSGRTGEGLGGRTDEGAWWEKKEQAAQREGEWGEPARGKGTSQGRPDLQSRSEGSFADPFFSEPLDLAMGGDIAPLPGSTHENDSEPHKRLSQMSRQERREYLRNKELASGGRADFDSRSTYAAAPQGVEPQPNRSSTRMHGPPPVRLGVADGFGILGWKL